MLSVCIKYSTCDLICDVITCFVWSCDTGKINASDKIMFENQKNRKYGNKIYYSHNLNLKDRLDIEFTACWGELMPQEALTSFTVIEVRK